MALSEAAIAVREAYARYRRMEAPNWRPSARWDHCWERTAELIKELGMDASSFMARQFTHTPKIMPNMLYGAVARRRAVIAEKSAVTPQENTERRFEYEIGYLQSRLEIGFSVESVLSDSTPGLTSLFRYCVARLYNFPAIAAAKCERAKLQLQSDAHVGQCYRQVEHFRPFIDELERK